MTAHSWSRKLLIATVLMSAFAGEMVDRTFVATPAWKALGPGAWKAYSLHADLRSGEILYPIYGVGLLVLALATTVAFRLDRTAPPTAGLPISLVALSAVGVMATTAKAAPIMTGLPDLGTNAVALQHAFDQFTIWGIYVRGVFGILALLTSLWALTRYPHTAATKLSTVRVNGHVRPPATGSQS